MKVGAQSRECSDSPESVVKAPDTEVEVNVVGVNLGGCLFVISATIGVHASATKRRRLVDETLAASYVFLETGRP